MARTSELTQEQINTVADEIKDQDKNPSPNAVRDILGTGSFSTIKKMLDIWKAQATEEEKIPVPPVPDFAHQLLKRLHKELYLQNHLLMENERLLLEATRQEFEVDKAEMLSEIARLEEQSSHLKVEFRAEKDLSNNLQIKQQVTIEKLDTVKNELSLCRVESATLLERNNQLTQQIALSMEELASRKASADTLAIRLNKKYDQLATKFEGINNRFSVSQSQLNEKENQVVNLNTTLESMHKEQDSNNALFHQQNVKIATLEERDKLSQTLIVEKDNQLRQSQKREDALQVSINDLKHQITSIKE